MKTGSEVTNESVVQDTSVSIALKNYWTPGETISLIRELVLVIKQCSLMQLTSHFPTG